MPLGLLGISRYARAIRSSFKDLFFRLGETNEQLHKIYSRCYNIIIEMNQKRLIKELQMLKTLKMVLMLFLLTACSHKEDIDINDNLPIDNEITYIGTTFTEENNKVSINNFVLLVDNGDFVEANHIIAESLDLAFLEEEIELNNLQIDNLNKTILNIKNSEEKRNLYYEDLSKEIINLEEKVLVLEKEIAEFGPIDETTNEVIDPQESLVLLINDMQTTKIVIETKKDLLKNKEDVIDNSLAELEIQIKNLEFSNKKLNNNKYIYSSVSGVILVHEEYVTLVDTKSYVNVNISENEIKYFKQETDYECEILYTNEISECRFVHIRDSVSSSSESLFVAVFELENKYYNNVSVEIRFEEN